MSVSFIHAADFHLGADLRRFGRVRRRLDEAQFTALEKTLMAAVERQASFVVICGDLFHTRRPSAAVMSRAASVFDEFRQVPAFIIPGTHDFLSENSPLSSASSIPAPENVRILNDPGLSPLYFEKLNVYIYFRPNTTNRSTQSPIGGILRSGESGIHIGLAHGSLGTGSAFANDFPLDPAEVAHSCLDYLALGHWHSPRIEKCGKTVAAYPGIPQPLSFSDPETGSVFHVTCGPGSTCIPERVETSTIRLKKLSATVYHPQDVKKLIDKAPDPNTILKLDLRFSDNCSERLEIERIIERAKSRYILVHEENHREGQADSRLPSPGDVNRDLINSYKAELERLRQADSPERAVIYEKAVELGTKIIEGDL